MKSIFMLLLSCLVPVSAVHAGDAGKALFEYYWKDDQVGSHLLADETLFSSWPDAMEWRTSLEGKTHWRDGYATRVRGYLHPPQSGEYTFWIASDDQSELRLSTDRQPANAIGRAWVNGWTPPREFDNSAEQKSDPIYLEAGRKYYLEVRHVEGPGGDNLAVAWQGPGIPERQVIDGEYLSSVGGLKGEYFNNVSLAGSPSWLRVDSQVDFGWGSGDILPGQADQCSVRWTGEVEIPTTDIYTFYVVTDDGARLWVDDRLLIDTWEDQSSTEHSSEPIPLTAGQRCRIRLEWYENAGGAACQLSWSSGSIAKVPIGQEWLSGTTVDPIHPGLVAWYKCDEETGSILYDSSGNGHHGQMKGNVSRVEGFAGKALEFGGSVGDHVDLGNWDPSEVTGQLTVAHWLYWSGAGGTWQGTVAKRDEPEIEKMMWQIELTTTSDPPGYIGAYGTGPSCGFTMPANQWVHVALTFDGSSATFYRNGQSVGTVQSFSLASDTGAALTLGATLQDTSSNPWKGRMDDTRFYNRALTSQEIARLVVDHAVECPDADMTGDCLVDLADFALLASQWLSSGFGEVIVPNVVGASQEQAELAILKAGLVIGTVSHHFDDNIVAGCVVNQNLSGGDTVWPGTELDMVVSRGSSMVRVPAGEFAYDGVLFDRMLFVDDFAIDKYEVTNAAYCEFLNADDPAGEHWDSGQAIIRAGSPGAYAYEVIAGRGGYPIEYVSYYDAVAYASWKSRLEGKYYRLPTDQEWQKAAGWDPDQQKLWTYGFQRDTIDNTWCNYGNAYGGPLPSGSFNGTAEKQDARSYYGCYDMSGNVTEWTGSLFDEYRLLRGGNYILDDSWCRIDVDSGSLPSTRMFAIGFRLVLDLNMAFVPAGLFAYQNGSSVFVDDFAISKYEVSNAAYCEFLNSDSSAASHWDYRQPITRSGNPGAYVYAVKDSKEDYPVNYVSHIDATAFATWKSNMDGLIYRLPTEQEWEKAAGWDPDLQRLWTYGFQRDTIDSTWCNYDNVYGGPLPIGSFDGTAEKKDAHNYYGCYDMSGNLWEWTNSATSQSFYVRGGNWGGTASGCEVTHRGYYPAGGRFAYGGFRLIVDL